MGEVRALVAELMADWEEEGAERIWVQVVTGEPLAEVLPVVSAVVREVGERVDLTDQLEKAGADVTPSGAAKPAGEGPAAASPKASGR